MQGIDEQRKESGRKTMGENSSTKGWAIVTGASSGMGLVFARELAQRGHNVLAVARRRDRLETLARDESARGSRIAPFAADLGTSEGLGSLVARIRDLGSIELLVNNAGVSTSGNFSESVLERELTEIGLNVNAVVSLTHAVLALMLPRKRGAIINLASVVAFQPFPHFAVYAASKAFVLSFTEALAEELKGSGVRIMALCPGAAKTEMSVFSRNEGLLGKLPSLSPDQIVRTALRGIEGGSVVKIVGWLNRVLVFVNRFVPRAAVRRMMATIAKAPSRPASEQKNARDP
jgi:short-subunit dehydrogenase